jgi:hypothetical protein
MKKGGNAAAKTFFTSHGVTATDMGRAETKYHCRAAEMYKTHIKKVTRLTALPAHNLCIAFLRYVNQRSYIALFQNRGSYRLVVFAYEKVLAIVAIAARLLTWLPVALLHAHYDCCA